MSVLKKWSSLEYTINQRNTREKVLLLFTGIAAILFCWELGVRTPIMKTMKKYDTDTVSTKKQITETQVQLQTILQKIRSDPSKSLNTQRNKLLEEIQSLQVKLNQLMSSLVRPNEMIGLLRSFVDEEKSIDILSIKNLEPVALTVEKVSNSQQKEEQKTVTMRLYKHGVNVQLKGNYFDALEYLQKLENVDKKIIWEMVDYQVDAYPLASITVTIKTISDQRSWIGV